MDKNYETVRHLIFAINRIDGVYYLFGRKLGVNENTLAFLYALADGNPHSQKEISDEWLIPRTTINSIVKTMLVDGYIMFCLEQHTKEKAIVLTESGRRYANKFLTGIFAAEEKAITKTLQKFSPEFVSALEDFVNHLYEEYDKFIFQEKEDFRNEQF